jgi:hypothetical protein
MTESYVKAYCLYKDVRIIVDLWVLFLPALFLFLAWMVFYGVDTRMIWLGIWALY